MKTSARILLAVLMLFAVAATASAQTDVVLTTEDQSLHQAREQAEAASMRTGESDSLRFVVRGVVRDASGGKALDAVAVTIPGTSYATVTNKDGSFVIKSDIEPKYVNFTLLGYNSQTLPVTGQDLKVRLTRGSIELTPATVISGDPLQILLYAISRIEPNSPQHPELFDCFYRETVQKRQRFIYVSEAVTKMYKAASSNIFGRDRAAVVKSRLLTSPRVSDTLGVKVMGGPVMAVDLDMVKQRDLVFDESQLSSYRLETLLPEVIDGRLQFVIGFSPAVEEDFALHYGKVYIDQMTYAISRLETSLDVSDRAKATRAMLVRKPAGLNFRPKEMWLEINYKPEADGKWRLSYLRTRFRFNCDWRKRLLYTDYTAVSEMVVTNRYTGADAVPIQRADEFRSTYSLADKTQFYADPAFWDAYNIIEPTVTLEHAIGKLKKAED